MTVIINIDKSPVKREHISYGISCYGPNITLKEIENVFYEHPDSQGMALIQRIEERVICTYNKGQIEAAPLLLLKNALDNISLLYEKEKS